MSSLLPKGFVFWDGLKYIITSGTSGTTILAGDAVGTSTANTVEKIQGNPILAQDLGSGQANFSLVWNGSAWQASNAFSSQAASGNLGDFYPNPTVRALWNAAVPEVVAANPTGTSGFVVGNVLQVVNTSANNQALGYGPLNLNNVSGTLAAGSQAFQSLSGDLAGTTAAATVSKIQHIPVLSTSLGLSQDGYVLTYVNADSQWEPRPSTTGSSLSGDVVGSITSNTVASLQGHTLSAASPSINQYLQYNGAAWEPILLSLSLVGDVVGTLSGTSVSTTVNKIRNNSIKAQTLGTNQDGYVLTWINSDGLWEAVPASGGGGSFSAGGDLSGSNVDQTVIKINGTSVPASPTLSAGVIPVLVAASSTSSTWTTITDSNVNASANIAGSKINMSGSGGITDIVASLTIQAQQLVATTEVVIGTSGPTITSGTGIPSGVPDGGDGSIYLRKDGSSTGTESIYSYEASTWVPVGSAAAGTAGGDLSGFYPNPTVIAIQQNAIDNTLLGATQDGYVLTWKHSSSKWIAEIASGFTAGGDLSGSSTNQSVISIHGTTVPASPSANTVLVATSGTASTWEQISNAQVSSSAAIGYTKLNLSGSVVNADISSSAAITVSKLAAGTSAQVLLNNSTPTPTWTTLSGDVVVGATGITTVNKIQGVVISGTPTNGQVLTATGTTAANWQTPTSGSFTAGGDLSGSSTNQTVIGLQTVPVSNTTPTNGQILTYTTSGGGKWEPQSGGGGGGFTAGGDLSGSSTDQTVVAIQGNPVNSTTLGSSQDGYVLTWDNTDGYYKANEPIVYYTINATDYITIFTEKIYPVMNITVNGSVNCYYLVFPTGISFQATIINNLSSFSGFAVLLTSATGNAASIVANIGGHGNASLTGLSNVISTVLQPFVIIGGSSSSNDVNTANAFVNSSTSIDLNVYGTVPDSNNGHLTWALTNYQYQGQGINTIFSSFGEQSSLSSAAIFSSNGNQIFAITLSVPQQFLAKENLEVNDGFTFDGIAGNLYAINLVPGSLSAPYQFGIPSGNIINTFFINNTDFSVEIGYSSDGATFNLGNTIFLVANQRIAVFGDGNNIFTAGNTTLAPVIINATNFPSLTYTINNPFGSTLIVDNSSGAFSLTLPTPVQDGVQYTFKDFNWTFSEAAPLTIIAGGSDLIEQSSSIPEASIVYYSANLSITLEYSLAETMWRVVSSTKNEVSINRLNFGNTSGSFALTDSRISDYFIDTSGGAITFTIDSSMQPFDGQILSFKDSALGGFWNSNNFTLTSNIASIENPNRVAGSPNLGPGTYGASVIFIANANYLQYRFDAQQETWFLISQLILET
jgi:hypothetical protein